jgi:hypothetical protein
MAAPALYDTIYDVLLNNQALYAGTHAINHDNQTGLYDEVSKLLTYFALADLRHDFEKELEIDINIDARSTQSIGLTQCDYICEAFYAAGSKCYKSLSYWARDKFMKEMSSDGTAKANFKKRMDDFFSGTGTFNKFRALFKDSAYAQPFDLSHDNSIPYNDILDKQVIIRRLTADPEQTAILVDSQMGNPLENIFNSPSTKNKGYYIVNFATTMDAATKPTANVHTYLKVFIQKANEIEPTQPIEPQLALFGPQTNINNFNFEDDTWATTAQIKFQGYPEVIMTFSNKSKASVNELGLIPIRGASQAEIDAAIAKLGKIDLAEKEAICAAHQFKSLGDRLQALSVSKYLVQAISYVLNTKGGGAGNLNQDKRADGAGQNISDMHRVTFINDILNLYQNWLLQNNFVDTGLNIITYYKSQDLEEKTRDNIIDSFKTKKAEIHAAIESEFNIGVNMSNLNALLGSLYDASVNLAALNYIKNNELLKEFITDVPEDSTLRDIIKESNYKQYQKYLAPSFHSYIKTIINTRMTKIGYNQYATSIGSALKLFNSSITDGNISTNIVEHIAGFSSIIASIEDLLQQINITKFSFFIALLLIAESGYGNINTLINHKMFYETIITFSGRRSVSTRKFLDATSTLSRQLISQFEEIYSSVFSYIYKYSRPIVDIDEINTFRQDIDKRILSGMAAAGGGGGGAGAAGGAGGGGGAGASKKRGRENSNAQTGREKRVTGVIEGHDERLELFNQNDISLTVLSKMASTLNLAIYIKVIKNIDISATLKQLLKLNGYKISGEASPVVVEVPAPIPRLVHGDLHPRKLLGFPVFPAAAVHALPFAAKGAAIKPINTHNVSLIPASLVENYPESSSTSYVSKITDAIKLMHVTITSFMRSRFQGGGSRSRSRSYSTSPISKASLEALLTAVRLKVFFMNLFLAHNRFAGCALFNSEIYAATLISDYEAMTSSKSKNKYVLIQSSIKSEPSSKSRSKTITSIVISSPPKVKSKRSVLFKSPEGKVKSIFKSQEEVKNKLIQQLIAFLWFGSSQSAEMKRLEKTLFSSLLPDFVNDLSSLVHYQLFWMPFMNRTKLSYEDLNSKFTEIALPIIRANPANLTARKVKGASPSKSRTKATSQTRKSPAKSQASHFSTMKKSQKTSVSQRTTRRIPRKSQARFGRLSTIQEVY